MKPLPPVEIVAIGPGVPFRCHPASLQ